MGELRLSLILMVRRGAPYDGAPKLASPGAPAAPTGVSGDSWPGACSAAGNAARLDEFPGSEVEVRFCKALSGPAFSASAAARLLGFSAAGLLGPLSVEEVIGCGEAVIFTINPQFGTQRSGERDVFGFERLEQQFPCIKSLSVIHRSRRRILVKAPGTGNRLRPAIM